MKPNDLTKKKITLNVKHTMDANGFINMAERKLGKNFTELQFANMIKEFYSEVAIEELMDHLTVELC